MAAALLGRTEIGVREYGTTTNVPSTPKAKLMYYLDCVCGLLDMSRESNLTRLRDYRRWQSLSEAETDALVALCFLLSPDVLLGKVIFQEDALCTVGYNSTFYELSAVRNNLLVYDTVLIGGQTRSVRKIMTLADAVILFCEAVNGEMMLTEDALCKGYSNTFYELSAVRNNLLVYDTVLIGGQTRSVRKIMACRRTWIDENWVAPMKANAQRLARIAAQVRRDRNDSSGCCCTIL